MATTLNEIRASLENPLITRNEIQHVYEDMQKMSSQGQSTSFPSELFVLCCEAAIKQELWDVAEHCLPHFAQGKVASPSLQARSFYCEAAVRLHHIPLSLRGQQWVSERQVCAGSVLRGISVAVAEYPNDGWVLALGLDHLWNVIAPVYEAGKHKDIVDVIAFVVVLFERLMTNNFDYTRLQWLFRYAVCFRGLGRFAEALAQLHLCLELAGRLENDRLLVQILRFTATTTVERDGHNPKGNKGESIFTKHPVFQAVYASQLLLCGYAEADSIKGELLGAYEKLSTLDKGSDTATTGPASSNNARPKSKTTRTNALDSVSISPVVIEEVLADVVLALTLCGKEGRVALPAAEKLSTQKSPRCKTFGMYGKVVVRCQQEALWDMSDALDVSYLNAHMVDEIKKCLRDVEAAMGTARMIEDASERAYTLQVGCALLWTLCLPLLQEDTLGGIRQTIHRICRTLDETTSLYTQSKLFVDVTYESCLADFSEDNLAHLAKRIFVALQKDYSVSLENDKLSYPMDFPLLWLLRRTQARTQADSSQFTLPEEEALYNLEQSKIVTTASKRVVLIKAAFNKLPPFPSAAAPREETENVEVSVLKGKQGAGGHKGAKLSATTAGAASPPLPPIPFSLAELYVSLLRECMKDLNSSLLPVAKSTAKTLSELHVPVEERYKNILLIKAEGYQCLVETLLAEQGSDDAAQGSAANTAAIPHLLQAASIGHSLSLLGFPSLHVVVNAAQTFLRVCRALVFSGKLDGLSAKFAEMYQFVAGTGISCRHEAGLVVELSLLYVVTLLFDYMKQKGDAVLRDDAGALTYDELVQYIVKFNKVDSGSAVLKRAQEVCWEIIQRVPSPAAKSSLCLLFPTVCRLHGVTKMEPVTHPQEQLLFLLGRLLGPVSAEEKSNLVSKDALALLKEDPSVELCGRMVDLAVACKDERTALDVCDIADALYKSGKLGWGTLFSVGRKETSGNQNNTSMAGKSVAIVSNTIAPFPKPRESDWMWYAHLLFTHATLFKDRMKGMDLASQHQLGLKIVQQSTNSAIAASHGGAATRARQITQALTLYYEVVGRLINTSCDKTLLFPSLKMMLSRSIQGNLALSSSNRNNDEDQERLLGIITALGRWLLQSCPTAETLKEGIQVVADLTKVLPTKFHSQFCVEEVTARTKLGFPVDSTLRVAKSSSARSEALAWMALATVTGDQRQAQEGWRKAIAAVQSQPLMKATVLIHFASFCIQKSALSMLEVKKLLLSALDVLEVLDANGTPGTCITTTTNTTSLLPTLTNNGTNRSRGMQGTLQRTRAQSGKTKPASLNETLCAMRAIYLLFSITAEFPADAAAVEAPETTATSQQRHDFPTKRECVLLFLRCMEGLWQVVDQRAREAERDTAAGDAGAGYANWYEAQAIPQRTAEWFGYVVDMRLLRAISGESVVDPSQNSEAMQEIYFCVIDYLLEHNMELFAFSVCQWTYLAAALRYGESSFQAELVKQCVFLYSQKAACLCNAGRKGVQLYSLPPSTLQYWALVEDGLAQVQPPDVTMRQPVDGVYPRPFAGTLHDLILRKAQLSFYFGDTDKTQRYAKALYRLCERVEDAEGMGRCLVLMAKCDMIRGDHEKALEVLQTKPASYLSSLSHTLFMELMLLRVDLLLLAARDKEAVGAEMAGLQTVIASERRKGEDSNGVRATLYKQAADHMQNRWYQQIALRWTEMSELGVVDVTSSPSFAAWRESTQAYLSKSEDWRNRLLALQLSPSPDESVDHAWVMSSGKDMDACCHMFSALKKHKSYLDDILHDIERDLAFFVPLFNGTIGNALTPSLQTEVSRVLQRKARLLYAVQLVAERVLLGYRGMTMADLRLPTTEAPQELTDTVLQYMRDPSETNTKQQETARKQQEWAQPTLDMTKEMANALSHYEIAYEDADLADASRFHILELLLSAAEMVANGCHPSYYDALCCLLQCEYQKNYELSVGPRATVKEHHATLLEAAVNEVWKKSAVALHVVATTSAGTKGHASKTLTPLAEEARPLVAFSHPLCGSALYIEKVCLDVIRNAEMRCQYDKAARLYLLLADLYVLWGRLQAAGCAIEHAQGANVMQLVFTVTNKYTVPSEEGSLARRYTQRVQDHEELLNTDSTDVLYQKWSQTSPMVGLFNTACEWGPTPDQVEPTGLDGVVLTIVRNADRSAVFVSLRQPDGVVHVRRRAIDLDRVDAWLVAFKGFLEEQKEVMLVNSPVAAAAKVDKDGLRLRTEDVCKRLEALEDLLSPLFADFAEYIKAASTKYSLYLCLDALFQALPVEHLPCLSAFHTISRELTASVLVRKASSKAVKYSSASLFVVDPFGDVPNAVEAVVGTDTKGKNGTILTCTGGKYPVQPDYLTCCMEDTRNGSILLAVCGPLCTMLTYEMILNTTLEHVQTTALITDGVCDSAVRRTQKVERMHGKAELMEEPWLAALLLHTRGVRCVCVNSFPCSAGALLTTAKRAVSGMGGGKNMTDCFSATTAKGKEGKSEWITFFGSSSNSSRKK